MVPEISLLPHISLDISKSYCSLGFFSSILLCVRVCGMHMYDLCFRIFVCSVLVWSDYQ